MECPNCHGTKVRKRGIQRGRQRYKCMECGANFGEGIEYHRAPKYPEIDCSCPRCGSRNLYRDGKSNDSQRYRCKECGLNFNSRTTLCDSEAGKYKCPYCDGELIYTKYISPKAREYTCSECGHIFKRLPYTTINNRKEVVSAILKGKKPSVAAKEYGYSLSHLRRIMPDYYRAEKITDKQKKDIVLYGYYLKIPVKFMAEYIKCSEHKCREVLNKFKKNLMSTNRDATV